MYPEYYYSDIYGDKDENVTGLIVKPPVKRVRSPIYISKYRKSVQEEFARNKYEHKTLGLMRVSLNKPDQYLRKNSGIHPTRPVVIHKHYHRPDYEHKLPAWEPVRLSKLSDKPSEKSNGYRKSGKNFKKENILNVRKSQVRTSHQPTDVRNSSNISKSTGPISISDNHQRISAENNVPAIHGKKQKRLSDKKVRARYLDRPTRTSTNSQDAARKSLSEADGSSKKNPRRESAPASFGPVTAKSKKNSKEQPRGRYVTEEERAELLYGMKKKWDEMMRQFQALPFLADTPPKAKRKSKMEEDLKQMEKDIDEIERHPHIYVYDDDGDDVKKS